MTFLSVRDAYLAWRRTRREQLTAGGVAILIALLGFPWALLAGAGIWIYLERPRKRYEALFWNQALALHSSKREGEPEIYEFMSKRHQREHAQLAAERFLRKDERA